MQPVLYRSCIFLIESIGSGRGKKIAGISVVSDVGDPIIKRRGF